MFANPLLKFYITKAPSACKSSLCKGVLFLCLPPPQLHSFWGEAKAAQSSRRGEAVVLQQEEGFPPERRCGVALGAEGSASPSADSPGRSRDGGQLRSPLVPSKPQLGGGRRAAEQGAFHPQNRNCGEQEHAKQECLGGWEVSGKRSSSERWHLRRLCLNAGSTGGPQWEKRL